MNPRKLGLLFLILGFGGAVETAWGVRNNLGVGPAGCRVLGGKFYGNSFSFDEEARPPLSEGGSVEVANAFGAVRIRTGAPGEVSVKLEKVIYVDTQERARRIASTLALRTETTGSTLRITTNRDEVEGRNPRLGVETHFTIEVPPGTPVKVGNEHGPVEVADVGSASIESSYDTLSVHRVAGDVTLKHRHGDVEASEVRGALSLESRYGNVEVRDVAGRAALDVHHGDVSANRIGTLTVDLKHGDLVTDGVEGELEARGEHNGVHVSNVGGRVVVEASYRDVELDRVARDASVRAQHGEVRATGVRGALIVRTSFDDVQLVDISGPVDATVEHGGLRAEKLASGLKASVSGDDVTLSGFKGPIEIDSRRAGVHLDPGGPLGDAITVTTTNGEIRLEVPAGSRFDLDAETTMGEVRVESVPGLTITQSSGGRFVGKIGEGGQVVKLRADHGDVTVERSSEVASKDKE